MEIRHYIYKNINLRSLFIQDCLLIQNQTKMKTLTKFFTFAIVLLAFAASTFAQGVTASASATATIVTPIAITKTVDMNFGNLAVNATPGTVVLTPAGGRSATGGVSFLAGTPGTITAASFDITGLGSATYSITLPAGATTIDDGASHTMTVDNWTSNPTPTGTLSAGGAQTVTVGATLYVGASQFPAVYTSATPFDVTVNYN